MQTGRSAGGRRGYIGRDGRRRFGLVMLLVMNVLVAGASGVTYNDAFIIIARELAGHRSRPPVVVVRAAPRCWLSKVMHRRGSVPVALGVVSQTV